MYSSSMFDRLFIKPRRVVQCGFPIVDFLYGACFYFSTSGPINKQTGYLLNNKKDALASGANYLSKLGWDDKLIWGEKVLPSLKLGTLQKLANDKVYKNQKYWKKFGINLTNQYGSKKLRIIIPDDELSDYYLVTKNFDVILRWNRSNYFALAVNILSDKIK